MRERERETTLASSRETTPPQSLSSAGGHLVQLATVNTCDYTNRQSVISPGDIGSEDGGGHCTDWEWHLVLERPHQLIEAGLQATSGCHPLSHSPYGRLGPFGRNMT